MSNNTVREIETIRGPFSSLTANYLIITLLEYYQVVSSIVINSYQNKRADTIKSL